MPVPCRSHTGATPEPGPGRPRGLRSSPESGALRSRGVSRRGDAIPAPPCDCLPVLPERAKDRKIPGRTSLAGGGHADKPCDRRDRRRSPRRCRESFSGGCGRRRTGGRRQADDLPQRGRPRRVEAHARRGARARSAHPARDARRDVATGRGTLESRDVPQFQPARGGSPSQQRRDSSRTRRERCRPASQRCAERCRAHPGCRAAGDHGIDRRDRPEVGGPAHGGPELAIAFRPHRKEALRIAAVRSGGGGCLPHILWTRCFVPSAPWISTPLRSS